MAFLEKWNLILINWYVYGGMTPNYKHNDMTPN